MFPKQKFRSRLMTNSWQNWWPSQTRITIFPSYLGLWAPCYRLLFRTGTTAGFSGPHKEKLERRQAFLPGSCPWKCSLLRVLPVSPRLGPISFLHHPRLMKQATGGKDPQPFSHHSGHPQNPSIHRQSAHARNKSPLYIARKDPRIRPGAVGLK